jgi:hypothetical protein
MARTGLHVKQCFAPHALQLADLRLFLLLLLAMPVIFFSMKVGAPREGVLDRA